MTLIDRTLNFLLTNKNLHLKLKTAIEVRKLGI